MRYRDPSSHEMSRSASLWSPVSNEKGFTLFEILISVAIIGTALIALLSLENRSIGLMGSAEMMEGARVLAERLMTEGEIKGVPGGELKGEEDGYRYTLTEIRLTPESMPEGVPVLPGRQLSLELLWMDGKREERLALAEYIYER